MQYLVRALKYLIYFMLFFFLIVSLLWYFTLKNQGLGFKDVFMEGSLPQIAAFFVVIAAVYPFLGFVKRKIYLNGDFSQYSNTVKETMTGMGYVQEKESEGQLTFRAANNSLRATRMWEDRITFTTSDNPVICEGLRKDVDKIARAINYKMSLQEKDNNTAS